MVPVFLTHRINWGRLNAQLPNENVAVHALDAFPILIESAELNLSIYTLFILQTIELFTEFAIVLVIVALAVLQVVAFVVV